jgi:hypothetical protein
MEPTALVGHAYWNPKGGAIAMITTIIRSIGQFGRKLQ